MDAERGNTGTQLADRFVYAHGTREAPVSVTYNFFSTFKRRFYHSGTEELKNDTRCPLASKAKFRTSKSECFSLLVDSISFQSFVDRETTSIH
jgi:hypothetical protein